MRAGILLRFAAGGRALRPPQRCHGVVGLDESGSVGDVAGDDPFATSGSSLANSFGGVRSLTGKEVMP
jgi:hypothetical protein